MHRSSLLLKNTIMAIPYQKLFTQQSSQIVLQNLYNLCEDAINVYLLAYEKVMDNSLKCDFLLLAHRRRICLEEILRVADRLNYKNLEKKPFTEYFINNVFTATSLTVPQLRDVIIIKEVLAFENDVEMACKLMPSQGQEKMIESIIEQKLELITATRKTLKANLNNIRLTTSSIAV